MLFSQSFFLPVAEFVDAVVPPILVPTAVYSADSYFFDYYEVGQLDLAMPSRTPGCSIFPDHVDSDASSVADDSLAPFGRLLLSEIVLEPLDLSNPVLVDSAATRPSTAGPSSTISHTIFPVLRTVTCSISSCADVVAGPSTCKDVVAGPSTRKDVVAGPSTRKNVVAASLTRKNVVARPSARKSLGL